MQVVKRTLQWLIKLNLFGGANENGIENEQTLRDQLLNTRVYLILLSVSFIVFILLSSFTNRTVSVTVSKPSLDTFEHLQAMFLDTISCPCQNIAVPYSSFLSFKFTYHQVRYFEYLLKSTMHFFFRYDIFMYTVLNETLTRSKFSMSP